MSAYIPPSILPAPTFASSTVTFGSSLLGSRPEGQAGSTGVATEDTLPEQAVAPAKMFVGGLPQTATQDTLREYFDKFGRINEAFVLMDESSGRSRGFGFVTFESPNSLQQVLQTRPHYIDGKHVDCKHAVLKSGTSAVPKFLNNGGGVNSGGGGVVTQPASVETGSWSRTFKPQSNITAPTSRVFSEPPLSGNASASGSSATMESSRDDGDDLDDVFLTGGGKSYLALSGDKWLEDCAEADERKIFVGGLPDVTPAEFASFFEHFGMVSDAMVMFDRKRRRQRGFGFITFATAEGVTNALRFHRHPVKGKLVEVKKAHPLVLQKARAPAKRERDAALERRRSPTGAAAATGVSAAPAATSTKRKTSSAGTAAPWSLNDSNTLQNGMGGDLFNWSLQEGKKMRADDGGDLEVDPFRESQVRSKFPSAPWNQDIEQSIRNSAEISDGYIARQDSMNAPPSSNSMLADPYAAGGESMMYHPPFQ